MNDSKYKIGEWENYRSIAKDYGLTIPALKKILKEEGLVEGNHLSKLAEAKEIGIIEIITSKFGVDERILWKVSEIHKILKRRNLFPLKGDEVYFFVENFSQLSRRIAFLASSLSIFLKLRDKDGNELESSLILLKKYPNKANLIFEALAGLEEAVYENDRYLRVINRKEFTDLLESDFKAAFELTKLYQVKKNEKSKINFFNRLYQFISDWATKKRIAQYRRQPFKKVITEM